MNAATPDIVFARHDGAHGIGWLRESYRMLCQHRLAWLLMLAGYYIALLIVEVVPLIGVLLAPMMKPVLSVGFLAAAWTQERGGRPSLRMLGRGFGANLTALLPLGLIFVAGISIALGATALIDGGRLLDLLYGAAPAGDADPTRAARAVQETLASSRVQLAMLFGALCALPTILALWWAPALVVFNDAPLRKALLASLRAAIANWRAVLRYAIGVFTLGAIVPTLATTGIALLVPPPINATLAALVVLPYLAFFVATLHIADYDSYRDLFNAGEKLAPIAGPATAPD